MKSVNKSYDNMKFQKKETKRIDWNWWMISGAFGMIGGFVFPLAGLLILKVSESGANMPFSLQKFTTTISLLTIPLLIFGSFCLNKQEISRKRIIG